LRDGLLDHHLADAAGDFMVIAYPYGTGSEIHGFPRDALSRAAGANVDHVVRGGLFGGRKTAAPKIAGLYERILGETLAQGHMGTEESVLTILTYRHPELFRCYRVEENGLIGPFFEALARGCAGSLLMRVPSVISVAESETGQDSAEDLEVARSGHTTFLGLPMMQNRQAVLALDALTRYLAADGVRPARLIEIGTDRGGRAALLDAYCAAQVADFITYALGQGENEELLRRLGVDRRAGDVRHEYRTNEIAAELQKEGISILLCDGADKVWEVSTFADYLKPGDLILAHDYAPSRDVFERELAGRVWSWCEITDEEIRGAVERNNLEPVLPHVFLRGALGCWVKRGPVRRVTRPIAKRLDRVGLYVLGYNAPDQFHAWLESVEETAPEILQCPERVLLNNSTDPSTFARYEELCRLYGFKEFRYGNLGINRGRIWCARHFDAETECDAILYFEDDMLLHTEAGVCPNGFTRQVPHLLERTREIVQYEDLDFLKFNFTEFFGDHTQNWAYYNLNEDERAEYFPDGPAMRVEAIKSWRGLSYLLCEPFYANWPMLMTRRGNRIMFLDDRDGEIPQFEQTLMVRALKLTRSGVLRGGVLLASPIRHHRIHHYPAVDRREC